MAGAAVTVAEAVKIQEEESFSQNSGAKRVNKTAAWLSALRSIKRRLHLEDSSEEKKEKKIHNWARARAAAQEDHLGPNPQFVEAQFSRMFRVARGMTENILQACALSDPFFAERADSLNKEFICPSVKALMGLKQLSHGVSCSAFVDCFQMGIKNTLQRHYYHPRLNQAVETLTHSCTACEQMKKPATQFGLLAPRQAPCAPWTEVHLDTIGPWSFAGKGNKRFSFFALTAIDPVTNLMEIKRHTVVPGKHPSAAQTWNAFHNCWLCRYPKLLACLTDNDPEFMGHDFQNAILHAQIRPKNSTEYNTQGNSICERAHITVAQVLRALLAQHNARPDTWPEAKVLIDRALAITQHATRCAASTALCDQSPGSIAFGRDMLINIPFIADFMAIRNARQLKIDQRLLRANAKRRPRDFAVNEQIFARNITAKSKLDPAWQGPFPIVRVHTNVTVTFARPNGVHERRNIRQIKLFA